MTKLHLYGEAMRDAIRILIQANIPIKDILTRGTRRRHDKDQKSNDQE